MNLIFGNTALKAKCARNHLSTDCAETALEVVKDESLDFYF